MVYRDCTRPPELGIKRSLTVMDGASKDSLWIAPLYHARLSLYISGSGADDNSDAEGVVFEQGAGQCTRQSGEITLYACEGKSMLWGNSNKQ